MACCALSTAAAAIEQNHDDKGIIWPLGIAPFPVTVIPLGGPDTEVYKAAVEITEGLEKAGVEVLLDDRGDTAGVKLNDADLIGIPYRVTLGPRGVAKGMAEVKARRGGETVEVEIARVAEHVAALVAAARSA